MFNDLNLFFSSLMAVLGQIFTLVTSSVLCGVLALWLLRKVVKFFKSIS